MAGEDGDYLDSSLRFIDDGELENDEINDLVDESGRAWDGRGEDDRGDLLQSMGDGKPVYNLSYVGLISPSCCNP